ncbi:AbrB/MazE/SpoVT family DNA-binding domain-containing protein [Exiguobacterium sp.]|uniref:AbrB/MazE/SpoVT family DNA-binding domain-containing protein n=1 Tax=Exiguobacterium sp. TaxID=44751 RepID=UPI0028A6653F|nr:AbrB/MazE/SpoVT family DNA-binding domain-containing protein [Exiguobacterium sp.]
MFIVRCLENNRVNMVEQKENRFFNLIQSKILGISLNVCYIGNKKSKEVRNTRKNTERRKFVMELSKLTSKGQITIPKKIRQALQVEEGDRVAFIEEDGFVIMAKADLKQLHDLQDILSDETFKTLIHKANHHL